jgi:uncharacterized membrane protein
MNVLHPPFVHFVIALPLAALFSQLTFLVTKNKTYAIATTRILAFSLLVSLFAIYGGLVDADKIIKNSYILENGIRVLEAHKTFGLIVVAILALTTLVKWFASAKNSLFLEKLSVALIIITILASVYQGNKGGSIVYKYAGGIDTKIIMKRAAMSE